MRSDVLESTILGILQNEPTHGYDLRQQLASILGPFRALSYGSLYPCLKRMERAGLISRRDDSLPVTPARRSKIVYELTPAGTEHFAGWIGTQTPSDWEDEPRQSYVCESLKGDGLGSNNGSVTLATRSTSPRSGSTPIPIFCNAMASMVPGAKCPGLKNSSRLNEHHTHLSPQL
jgi:DNA-binding PadR family transcriptional regulator